MPRCSFCRQNYEFPRGLTLILNDGNILYFCSGKCRKNMLRLKRESKKVNWVRKSDASSQSDAAVHPDVIQTSEQAPKPAEKKAEKPAQKEEKKQEKPAEKSLK